MNHQRLLFPFRPSCPLCYIPSSCAWSKQPDTASRSTNLTNLAHLANCTLVLRLILRAVERAGNARRTTVNRGIRCSANIEFGELVELNVYLILWTPFALSLDLLRLRCVSGRPPGPANILMENLPAPVALAIHRLLAFDWQSSKQRRNSCWQTPAS